MIRPLIVGAALALATVLLLGPAVPANSLLQSYAAPAARVETSATAPPLIILMDTSGSMEETVAARGDSGTVKKLDAAKAALQQPIRDQPPGSRLGIQTYPGGTRVEGCETGSWLVDLDSGTGSTAVLDQIDALTAAGDTPTGPALEAVIADLKDRGITSANIVVVSDGLYTCGTDPCEVAKGLAGTGFSVTIQAVGFAISAEGAENLACMAEATGGKYFDAADSDELTEVINRLTTPEFELTIVANPEPAAGMRTMITATVVNKSSYDAQGVSLSLTFDTSTQLIVPRVVPASIALGTLPAGQSATRKWTVVAGPSDYSSTAKYFVSASSALLRPVTAAGFFTTTTTGSEASDAGPILSDLIDSGRSLVIMGDSFSSGQGTYSYLPQTDDANEGCHRSADTYLARTFTEAGVPVEILACSGAVTEDFRSTQFDKGEFLASPQLKQLAALDSTPGAVVMTLGGNDIKFAEIVSQCVTPQSYCASYPYTFDVLERPSATEANLVTSYVQAWATVNRPELVSARGGAYAPLIVLAYPQAVHEGETPKACPIGTVAGAAGGFDVDEATFATDLVSTLNTSVKAAVAEASRFGIEIYYVATTEDAFAGHTLCADANRWVNRVDLSTVPPRSESVHPNLKGYSALTYEIIQWSNEMLRDESFRPSAQAEAIASGERFKIRDDFQPTVTPSFDPTRLNAANPGQIIQIDMFDMGTAPVSVEIHSTPRLLTTLTPNEAGAIEGTVAIPDDTPLGPHELVLTGWDKDGNKITKTATIVVKPMTPIWVWAIGIASALLLLGAIIFALTLCRRTRLWIVGERIP